MCPVNVFLQKDTVNSVLSFLKNQDGILTTAMDQSIPLSNGPFTKFLHLKILLYIVCFCNTFVYD